MSPPSTPPLDPANDEARRWLADELTKDKYQAPPDLFGWLGRLFDRLATVHVGGFAFPGWVVPTVTTVVLVIAVILVLRSGNVGPGRRRPRSGAFIDDLTLTAADYRLLAADAVAAEDWDTVALQSFRALAVGATERTLLTERPGRTAHEAVVELGPVFPAFEERLSIASDVFDLVRYGGSSTTRGSALAIRDLDDELRLARPVLTMVEAPA
jgi:hypothetical protein